MTNFDVAMKMQEQGLNIYPLAPGTKVPLKGSNGFNDATSNKETIQRWWNENANYNIGLNLKPHNLVVVDFDRHTEDVDGWENFKKLGQTLVPTYIERTPRDGLHFFFRLPTGKTINQQQNVFSKLLGMKKTGIDIVTYGIPIAPTVTKDGAYKIMDGKSFDEIAELPNWIVDALEEKPVPQFNGKISTKYKSGEFLDQFVGGASTGERNTYIRIITDRMLGFGAEVSTVYELVLMANDHFLDEPLPMNEINATFKTRVKNHLKKRGG